MRSPTTSQPESSPARSTPSPDHLRHDGGVDLERTLLLRASLGRSGLVERTRSLGRVLRRVPEPGRLLLVGTPEDEPWHLAAHLDDESRRSGLSQLSPTLVRWAVPQDAPPHLATSLARLEQASRRETVFVVAPTAAPEGLLQRVSDARRIGATVLSVDQGDEELDSMVHERLVVPRLSAAPLVDFDGVSHLVSLAAGENTAGSLRDRLGQLLDRVSGPAPRR